MTTTTANSTAVLLLPSITATRAARIEAAHSRHSRPELDRPAIWAGKPGQPLYCPAHLMTPAQLEATAEAAARNALQRREQASGLHLMRELLQSAPQNITAANLPAVGAEALTHERAHRHHSAQAAAFQAIADRKTTPPAEARAAREEAKKHRQKAEQHRQTAESLCRVIATASHTDLADIISAAKLTLYAIAADPAADLLTAYPEAVKAASKAIDTSATASALTSTRTAWTPTTPEAARAWSKAHPNANKVYFTIRDSERAGYITLEYWKPEAKKRKSRRPEGWYFVRHYNTVSPYVSFEDYTQTAAGQAAVSKNDGINAIQNAADAESIAALLSRANLSPKEQEICYKTADQTAARHAAAAEHDHMEAARARAATQSKDTARKTLSRARATAATVGAEAALQNALDRCHIYHERTRRRYVANIREALTEAMTPAAIQTAEERAEQERKTWERMQRSATRARAAAPISRPDILEAVTRAAAEIATAAAVVWLTDYPAPEAVTAEEAAKPEQERRAHLAAHAAEIARLDHRRKLYTAPRQSRTAYAAHDAQTAARVFWDAMTPAEQDESMEAWRAARAAEDAARAAAEAEAARRAKFPPEVYGLNTTFPMWRKWDEETRAEHLRFLDSLRNS